MVSSLLDIRNEIAMAHGYTSWQIMLRLNGKEFIAKMAKLVSEKVMRQKAEHEAERLAMSIVHHLGEFYKLPVTFRQRTNDEAIDWVQAKILEYANPKINN